MNALRKLFSDSRGKQSTTLLFVALSWLLLSARFFLAGLALGPLGTVPDMTGGSYGAAVAAILAIWLGREWTEKSQPRE